MSPDLQELEAKLSALRPAALDSELLARLADSATGDLTTLTPAAAELETALRRLRPAPLPAALTAALTATVAPVAPAIIPFPTAAQPPARASHWNRQMLSAAAAVAILGASAALFLPRAGTPQSPLAANPPTAPQAVPGPVSPLAAPASNLAPAAFHTGLSRASDEGVIWQNPTQPRRVVKVVYWDRITLTDADGRKVEVEQPRVEYILVPEKVD
jgi:hypothetical protein